MSACKLCGRKQEGEMVRGICDFCGNRRPRWHEQRWVDDKAVEFAGLIEDAEAAAKAKGEQG